MIGLFCGVLGFIVHSFISISMARKRLQNDYGIADYWHEHKYAIGTALLILVLTYLAGITSIAPMLETLLPSGLVDIIHGSGNTRILWALFGFSIPTVTKRVMAWEG